MKSFASSGLLGSLKTTLSEKGLQTPTEIQARTIPALLDGRSVVGISETGSGKTFAYALPTLHRLKSLEDAGDPVTVEGYPRALVLVPSRELGEQVARVFKIFTHGTRLRVRSVLGGAAMDVAKKNVAGAFEILVATPGRLLQFVERGLVNLSDIRTLVFDEADQMLDQGFLPDLLKVVEECPSRRQMALFTATAPDPVRHLALKYFGGAEIIESAGSRKTVATLQTRNRGIKDGKRFPVLEKILAEKNEGGTLLFVNTREQCDKLAAELKAAGHECAIYRGEMDKNERRANLKAFREGTLKLLVATDLGARGLDVEHVERVINYHLPQEMENYLHRAGRTARAGREGTVINFVTERDRPLMNALESGAPPSATRRPTPRAGANAKAGGKSRPKPRR